LQVFSNDSFVGKYPYGYYTRAGGDAVVVGDEPLTIINSWKVTIIFNSPLPKLYADVTDNDWLFYVSYNYLIPDGVGKYHNYQTRMIRNGTKAFSFSIVGNGNSATAV
jgi:hypothetical protein